jgi:hypothetical protein
MEPRPPPGRLKHRQPTTVPARNGYLSTPAIPLPDRSRRTASAPQGPSPRSGSHLEIPGRIWPDRVPSPKIGSPFPEIGSPFEGVNEVSLPRPLFPVRGVGVCTGPRFGKRKKLGAVSLIQCLNARLARPSLARPTGQNYSKILSSV